jgi:hypothetical protein
VSCGRGIALSVGGLPFVVTPGPGFSANEEEWLLRLRDEAGEAPARSARTFQLDLVAVPPWTSDDRSLFPDDRPARIESHGQSVRISRSDFVAELDPGSARGRLFRRDPGIAALQVALKTAMAARLPFEGGLPLHAAAVVRDGEGLVFFGPSGAGKSTLASTSPFPVLSDELVAIVRDDLFRVRATGFWGTLDREGAPRGSHAVAALFELAKGPRLEIERLDPAPALRRLLGVVLVPPVGAVWSRALGGLKEFVTRVPVLRLTWSRTEPPWDELSSVLSDVHDSSRPSPVRTSADRPVSDSCGWR